MPNHLIFFFSIHSSSSIATARMHAEIADQVLLRLALPVAVPAGMDDQDVAVAESPTGAASIISGVITAQSSMCADISTTAPGPHQKVERVGRHVAHAVGAVHGAVDMGADVQRGVDPLRHDHLGLQVLRVIHLVAGITDPAGRVDVHEMGEVDNFHVCTWTN